MAISDGKFIILQFSEALQGDLAANAGRFSARAPRAGVTSWQAADLPIAAVEWFGGRDKIRLVLGDTNQDTLQGFGSPVTVTYRGGTLRGAAGPLLGFSASFNPSGVPYRGNQIQTEHAELSGADLSLTVTRIYYTDTAAAEHVELSGASAVLTIIHVDDL